MTYDVAIGCDHAGFDLHQAVIAHWRQQGVAVYDVGAFSSESVDYPLCAASVCKAVLEGVSNKGLLICGSGIGVTIAANRFRGIRAVWADRPDIIFQARQHNNANVLCVGSKWTNLEQLLAMWHVFIQTSFEDAERHNRRIALLDC